MFIKDKVATKILKTYFTCALAIIVENIGYADCLVHVVNPIIGILTAQGFVIALVVILDNDLLFLCEN